MEEREYSIDNTIVCNCKEIKVQEDDCDMALYHDILGYEKVDAAFEDSGVNLIHLGEDYEYYPIKIEELEKILKELKESGCNYISIDYNPDHPDYTFYGIDVHAATEEEIVTQEEKENKEFLEKTVKLRNAAKKYLEEAEKLENKIKK